MKRVIVDYSKLTNEILDLLVDKFPDGYDYHDIISFKNMKGEIVEAVEVKTEDTIYLVKVSSKLERSMEHHDSEEDDEDDDDFDDNNDDFDTDLDNLSDEEIDDED
ncbi:hypothetical protein [Urechidicola croceus]|uniref:DNA primase n=1 Tax=Urechidicola croceus TaxID=1850246 RepID=A0A1D8PBL9_9FLAO|nr:hypothetical protein [Urechidicola croceus]AOW21901.1 hypothetical protein LPB138_14935 [Urechidicola croceus]